MESLGLTVLYMIVAVAFIGAFNARGVVRTSLAALLALACLGAALWHTNAWRARKMAGVGAVGFVFGGENAPAPGHPASASGSYARASGAGGGEDLREDFVSDVAGLVARAMVLRAALAAEDPSRARALSDEAYQAFEARAGDYVSRSRRLREQAAHLATGGAAAGTALARSARGANEDGAEEAVEALNEALQALTVAARDLRAFLRATGREEEQRLAASFRRGVQAAAAPLRRAAAGVGTGFPPSGD
ncbi:MAG TPA: hypothetical protein VKZ88_05905 [Fibrobacteria bacterium]|nr:hypothetical protein [Fibrobacteria bacterium]